MAQDAAEITNKLKAGFGDLKFKPGQLSSIKKQATLSVKSVLKD